MWIISNTVVVAPKQQQVVPVVTTHLDDATPYYTIRYEDGTTRQTTKAKLRPGRESSITALEPEPEGESAKEPELKKGTEVVIHGLQAKPELNGARGKICGLDEKSWRYEATIPSSAVCKLLQHL